MSSSVLRGNGSGPSPDFDVICLSHLRWDFSWQRSQQLLSRCAQRRRVFFVEERVDATEPRLELRPTESGVVLVQPHFPSDLTPEENDAATRRALDELITRERIEDYVLWFSTPMATAATRHLEPLATVYDNMDELTGFRGAPPELVKREQELLERADLVFTGGQSVARPYGDAELVRSADDANEFVAAVEAAMAEDAHSRERRVDAFLTENSWDYTWADMNELITRAVKRRLGSQRVQSLPTRRIERFDWLVVGAGFAGATLAERLARDSGQRVLVCDRRNHIGGNAYDHYDDAGILVHRYGPHIFHTNSKEVFDYLTHFTEWRPYQHRVLASVDGQLLPFPINLDTVNRLYGLNLNALELEDFFASQAEPRQPVRTSEDVVVSKVGRDLYLKFFRNYTRKQWDLDPSELDASVTSRVPTRLNRDDRYFTDTYQAMPLHGYTRMFERMLDHQNIKVLLNADYREVQGLVPYDRMVYTGPIDEYFGFRYGKLPYRSLEFRFETHDVPIHQQAPVVNFPNENAYTRVTEFKYLTGQEHDRTTIVYEYPQAEGDPYYPVPRPENAELYKQYKALAEAEPATVFVGRLATYKYYNMDQVVAQALATYRRLREGDDLADDLAARALGRRRVQGQPSRRRLLRSG